MPASAIPSEEDSRREVELDLEKKPFEISPLPDVEDEAPIVAVDASAIPLGETDKGIVAAVRTAGETRVFFKKP